MSRRSSLQAWLCRHLVRGRMAVDPMGPFADAGSKRVNRIRPASAIGLILFAGLIVAATAILTAYYLSMSPTKHLDSVFLYESAANVIEVGRPVSETVASWPRALELLTVPTEEFCRADLGMAELPKYDILESHAYFAIYPIALLLLFTTPEAAFSLLNALAHLTLVFAPVFYLWRRVGVLAAAAFGLWIALYPAWSLSATGDYYLDRLYMPFALMSLFVMHGMVNDSRRLNDPRWIGVWVMTVLCAAAFTERAALMMLGSIAFFILFFPNLRRSRRAFAAVLGAGLALVAYLVWYFTTLRAGVAGGGDLLGNISTDLLLTFQKPEMVAFVVVNVGFCGVLVVAAGWRYLLLAAAAILPNLLISVGGAELSGWSTHYHTMYMPFVLFAATIGYDRLVGGLRGRSVRFAIVLGVGAGAVLFGGSIDPYTGRAADRFGAPLEAGIAGRVLGHSLSPSHPLAAQVAEAASLDHLVPRDVSVSTVEAAMPSLYRHRSVSYFPIGLDDADYLVVPGVVSEGRVESLIGDRSYLGPDVSAAINACLLERAVDDGYELVEQVGGWLVMKRSR